MNFASLRNIGCYQRSSSERRLKQQFTETPSSSCLHGGHVHVEGVQAVLELCRMHPDTVAHLISSPPSFRCGTITVSPALQPELQLLGFRGFGGSPSQGNTAKPIRGSSNTAPAEIPQK